MHYTSWKFTWDELEIQGFDTDVRYVVVEARNAAGELVWSHQLDATKGHSDLMPRTWLQAKPTAESPVLQVGTDGEHYRGASSHEEQLFWIDKAGNLI